MYGRHQLVFTKNFCASLCFPSSLAVMLEPCDSEQRVSSGTMQIRVGASPLPLPLLPHGWMDHMLEMAELQQGRGLPACMMWHVNRKVTKSMYQGLSDVIATVHYIHHEVLKD